MKIIAALLLAGTVTLAGCSDDSTSSASDTTTTTAARSTTTTVRATTTTAVSANSTTTAAPGATTAPLSPLDWDGAKFDAGEITSVESDASGLILVFDRYGYYATGDGAVSGPQLTEEPVVYYNTDSPWTNDSKKTRRFRVAPDAEFLVMNKSTLGKGCDFTDGSAGDGIDTSVEPTWDARPLDTLRTFVGSDDALAGQISLTYSPAGLVQRIRVSYAC